MAIKLSDHFSTTQLHRKEITVGGVTDEVFVRRLPAVDLRRYVAEITSDNIETRTTAGFSVLVKAIRNEDGSPAGLYEDYKKLDGSLLKELIRVFQEVNTQEPEGLGNS